MTNFERVSKLSHSTLPRKTVINKNDIFEEKRVANKFNIFFINIGPNLANDIPTGLQDLLKVTCKKTNERIKDEPITIYGFRVSVPVCKMHGCY